MPAYRDKDRGTWTSSFRCKDWTGKVKRKVKRGFATKREALEYESRIKLAADASMDMVFEDFVEVYFRDKVAEFKQRTANNKRYMIERHVVPYFKGKSMNDIKPADIIAWQNEIRAKEYSESYMRMLQNQLTALINHAQRIYNLQDNPCKKVKKIGRSDVRRLEFWTIEEYRKFIDSFEKGSKGYMMFQILFWTGCRLGEMLALTKNDIDLAEGMINITKTIYRVKGEDIISTPKTEESVRSIAIPQFLVKELREYENNLYKFPDDELLFPVSARAVELTLDRHAAKAGIKKINVHSIRHSHCAYLINQGIPAMVIKERLGHKDIKITLNTYGHLYPSEQKKVADMMDSWASAENEKVPGAANTKD